MSTERASVPLHGETLGGEGRRVVFLHGLLGSGRNWRFVTGRLSKVCRTYALDLRNHGHSPHTPPFTLDDLASDVEAWMTSPEGSGPAILVGHSLGGKTAMRLACRRPDLVEKLVIVDISTESAPRRWGPIFAAMLSIDLAALKTRKDAEDILEAKGIADWGMRKFLASGLDVDGAGKWRWRANVESLNASADAVTAKVLADDDCYEGPAFLIRGALSDYAPLADIPAMKRHFPALRVETIPDVGHNVHVEAPHQFIDALLGFINA